MGLSTIIVCFYFILFCDFNLINFILFGGLHDYIL